jgi:hypothetical protein
MAELHSKFGKLTMDEIPPTSAAVAYYWKAVLIYTVPNVKETTSDGKYQVRAIYSESILAETYRNKRGRMNFIKERLLKLSRVY